MKHWACVVACVILGWAVVCNGEDQTVRVRERPATVDHVEIRAAEDGALMYHLTYDDGRVEQLDPQAFTRRLYEDQQGRGWFFRLLNISTVAGVAWVGLGLLGQVLFTGRMVVQWVASERHRRSVVPVSFWWMSLLGASMLILYFVWRRDIVGVLGQATGWGIYVRNLILIYRPHPAPAVLPDGPAADAGPR